MTEHILSMIGLAKKAGQVAIGEEPVGAAARAKDARVILVAQDAAAGAACTRSSGTRARRRRRAIIEWLSNLRALAGKIAWPGRFNA